MIRLSNVSCGRGRKLTEEERRRLEQAGLRPVEIWVPDTGSPDFAKAAHEQSLAVARSRQEREDQAFVDAVSELDGE